MYAAIYGYSQDGNKRVHLGNVRNIEYTDDSRTYDFNSAQIKGVCEFEIQEDLIYVINTENGKAISAGFTKNVKKGEGTEITFKGDDFKRILDTDVLIDFTNEIEPSFTLKSIFERVTNAVQASNRDPFISKIPLNFIIPNDLTDTKFIADYTGQYLIVNALKFLKVYMSYYGYFIKPIYSEIDDEITFEFKKSNPNQIVEIKLKDFKHEKTSSDIKVNKTIATIAFTPTEIPPEWEESTFDYFNSQPESNRATIEESENLPPTTGYNPGFALRVITQQTWYKWVSATATDYNLAPTRLARHLSAPGGVCAQVPIEEAIENAGNPANYAPGTVISFRYVVFGENQTLEVCPLQTYIKLSYGGTVTSYYKLGNINYTKRPNLPERVYLLGKDNQIYDGYQSIPENQRIYPIISKMFEAKYLAEAQVNAVYELVNNRYIENIIITQDKINQPLDLAGLELYTMVRVYDDDGEYKDLPISEKTTTHNSKETRTKIKLGFKKTLLTEIIKNDIDESGVVKSTSGGRGGTTTIIEPSDIPLSDEDNEPDPTKNNIWFAIT